MAYTTIDKPSDYFETVTYAGGTTDISSLDFQPDFVWGKKRTGAENHALFDSVRGATKTLNSNTTAAESTRSGSLTSFDSDGFTMGGSDGIISSSGNNYVAWNWKAGGTASSNTDGSITSSVSANTDAGFSIVSYTGTGSNATVGHGLGVAPKVLILKSRTRSDGQWTVGSDMLTWSKFLFLDATSAEQTFNLYQNTAPTSSVFYLSGDGGVNQSSGSMIGYAFAEKQGYSKFGSYVGNGNADGPFIYTGFKPAFVMLKNTSATGGWLIADNKRDPENIVDKKIFANLSNAEGTDNVCDFLSNGFKLRTTDTSQNGSGNIIIYMAIAENPFVTSTGVCATAR
jgi:hypothetical protein